MTDRYSETAIAAGRGHIAYKAKQDGEHIFAREVIAGCWDHRNDVAKAIAKAGVGDIITRTTGYLPCRIVSKAIGKDNTVMVEFEDGARIRLPAYRVKGANLL